MSERTDDDLAGAWHELMGRYHRITCSLDRELMGRHGITASDFEVLQQLHDAHECAGTLRMHDLGDQVHLSQSALSRLVSRLEREGLVERGMCEDDRRAVWTRITAEGARRYEQARPTQRSILLEQAVGCIEQSEHTFATARSVSRGRKPEDQQTRKPRRAVGPATARPTQDEPRPEPRAERADDRRDLERYEAERPPHHVPR